MNGRKATLPGLPAVNTNNVLDVVKVLAERSEVREGARGDKLEATVTQRDLLAITKVTDYLSGAKRTPQAGDVVVDLGGGLTASIAVDKFAEALRNTKLFKDLQFRLDDPARFAELPAAVRDLVEGSIAEKAAKLGAQITRVENKTQSAISSLAITVDEVTASVEGAAAGVRQVTFAFAEADKAQAGKITQVQARLNGTLIPAAAIGTAVYANSTQLNAIVTQPQPGAYYQVAGNPKQLYVYDFKGKYFTNVGFMNPDGSGTRTITSTLEQQSLATVDRVSGAETKYTVKLAAGGAIAGFGVLASDNLAGQTTSAFIIQADKFAVVGTNVTTGLTNTPNPASVPFGIDTDTNRIYLNGSVYLKGTLTIDSPYGKTLQSGLRGSLNVRKVVPVQGVPRWDDNIARFAIWDALGQPGPFQLNNNLLVIGDTVEQFDANGSIDTRRWMGDRWDNPGQIINGNLLVDGTIAATKINTQGLTIRDANGQPVFTSGVNPDFATLLKGKITLGTPDTPGTVVLPDGSKLTTANFLTTLSKATSGTLSNFLADSAITSALIGRAEIKSANIESLAVTTLKIGPNAVTVPFFATNPVTSSYATVGSSSPNVATTKKFLEADTSIILISTHVSNHSGLHGHQASIGVRHYDATGYTILDLWIVGFSSATFENRANLTASGNIVVPYSGYYDAAVWVNGESGGTCESVQITALGGQR